MAQFTIAYNEKTQGFPTFFSYIPQRMIGMNNKFYTFNNGELYVHNDASANRNEFYGTPGDSSMVTVVNDSLLDTKLFKTINLEGTHPWEVIITSDIQTTGYIESGWLEKKEGSFRGYIRSSGEDPTDVKDIPLRSMNGIGKTQSITSDATHGTCHFTELADLTSATVGDIVYFADAPTYDVLQKYGTVNSYKRSLTTGLQTLKVTLATGDAVPATQRPYIMTSKSAMAESHGILGHYARVTLTNSDTNRVALFGMETEVMLSQA